MTTAVKSKVVRTTFECLILRIPNALRILKLLTSVFDLLARIVGNVLGFADYFVGCGFCSIRRFVYLLFRFVFKIVTVHALVFVRQFEYPVRFFWTNLAE